jgi:hypothetical protein
MYPLELIQSVRLITDVCLEIAPGENVLCVTDSEEKMDVVTLIAAECKRRGAETSVILLEPRKEHDHDPPRSIARAIYLIVGPKGIPPAAIKKLDGDFLKSRFGTTQSMPEKPT